MEGIALRLFCYLPALLMLFLAGMAVDGPTNGIRIKSDPSRGGLVQDVQYESICIRNVTNPIVLTTLDVTGVHDIKAGQSAVADFRSHGRICCRAVAAK